MPRIINESCRSHSATNAAAVPSTLTQQRATSVGGAIAITPASAAAAAAVIDPYVFVGYDGIAASPPSSTSSFTARLYALPPPTPLSDEMINRIYSGKGRSPPKFTLREVFVPAAPNHHQQLSATAKTSLQPIVVDRVKRVAGMVNAQDATTMTTSTVTLAMTTSADVASKLTDECHHANTASISAVGASTSRRIGVRRSSRDRDTGMSVVTSNTAAVTAVRRRYAPLSSSPRHYFTRLLAHNDDHYIATGEHWFTVAWSVGKPRQHDVYELFPGVGMRHAAVRAYTAKWVIPTRDVSVTRV